MNTVVYCIDKSYFEPLKVSLYSLLRNASKPLQIFVVSDDLSGERREELSALVRWFEESQIFFKKPIREKLKNLPIHLHFSRANFDRIYLPEILGHIRSPILYIDADTIFRGDANELFELFNPRLPLAACQDYLGTIFNLATRVENPLQFGCNPEDRYFNSGLLMMNPELWRKNDFSAQLANFCQAHPETLFLADQSAMNIVFQNQVQFLPNEWNVQTVHPNILNKQWGLFYLPQYHENAKMIHFTTELKPWNLGKDLPEAKFYFETKHELDRVSL